MNILFPFWLFLLYFKSLQAFKQITYCPADTLEAIKTIE